MVGTEKEKYLFSDVDVDSGEFTGVSGLNLQFVASGIGVLLD